MTFLEVISDLTKNPFKTFVTTIGSTTVKLRIKDDSFQFSAYNHEGIETVIKPQILPVHGFWNEEVVTWQEALEAFSNGKTVSYVYSGIDHVEKDWITCSADEIKYGKWYIRE